MANKFFAVFLICMVVAATFNVQEAMADKADDKDYKSCFEKCDKQCKGESLGSTVCEMKCDSECAGKILAEKLNAKFH